MLVLECREEVCLVSGMAMPPAFQFDIGFAMARATRRLPETENAIITMNRIVEGWKGLAVKRLPADFNIEKPTVTISG
jgi:hypothetical protein